MRGPGVGVCLAVVGLVTAAAAQAPSPADLHGLLHEASATALQASDENRWHLLSRIGDAQQWARDFNGAVTTFERALQVSPPDRRVDAILELAEAQADAGDRDAARSSLGRALRPGARVPDHAAFGVARIQAKVGDMDAALRTAGTQRHVQTSVVAGQIARGDRAGARALLAQLLADLAREPDDRRRGAQLGDLALLQADAGDVRGAARMLQQATQLVTGPPRPSGDADVMERLRGSMLIQLAQHQARIGERSAAMATAETAVRLAHGLPAEVDFSKAQILADAARLATSVAQPRPAWLAEARQVALTSKDPGSRGAALIAVAELQADTGDAKGALATAMAIWHSSWKEQMQELAPRAEAAIAALSDPAEQAEARAALRALESGSISPVAAPTGLRLVLGPYPHELARVAAIELRAGERAEGAQTLDHAYRETISPIFGIDTMALANVAKTEAKASGWRAAAERARKSPDPTIRAAALEGVSRALLDDLKLPRPLR